jgi:hypothetical protein
MILKMLTPSRAKGRPANTPPSIDPTKKEIIMLAPKAETEEESCSKM